jgi:acetylornithine deacetylase/succinyl-diaminopimelate desuccinylase-like protein
MSDDRDLDRSLALLRDLVACPSVLGTATTVLDLLADRVAELGCRVQLLPVDPRDTVGHPEHSPVPAQVGAVPPVLVADFPGDGPELLLFAHTDTEPVHDGWTTDPFALEVSGGRATGLGVADDAAGVVALVAAVRRWDDAGRPGWRPRIVLGAGKQGGALGTLPGVLAAAGVDAALYSHPAESGAGLTQLKTASRGIATCRVHVPGLTPDPVEERTPVSADPAQGHNAAERAARLAAEIAGWSGPGRVWTTTALTAGGPSFTVPDHAVLEIACWFDDGTADDVRTALESWAGSGGDPWERAHPPVVELVGLRAQPADCSDHPFVARVTSAVAAATGTAPTGYRWHSASDVRFPIRCLGVPAVGLGPLAGGFYGPGEWVDLASLEETVGVLATVLGEGPTWPT